MSKIKKSSKLRLGDELVNERIKELGIEVKEGKKTWREVAEQIKEEYGVEISKEAVRKRYESGSIRECNKRKEEEIKEYETRYSDNTIESRKIVEYNKEVFGDNEKLLDYLGFNHNEWEFVYVTMSTWEQHTKEQNTKQLYSVKFKVRPKIKEIDTYRAIEIAKETFKEEIEPITFERKIEDKELGKNKLMLIPQIEAHLGKLSNEIETGTNYDHKIVEERVREVFRQAIELQEREKCDRCLLVVGGDFFNSESNSQTTSGTPQQNDTRYKKMFNIGLKLYLEGINALREHFNKVDVKICAGNHSRAMEFFLYIALSCCFREDNVVNFSDNYRDTQSYVFGNVGLFFNHGDPNQKRLISSIPAEFYEEYGKTKHRYLFLGHLHKLEVINSENGLTVHRVPAICENDNWHYQNRFGIGNIPQHEIIVFDKNKGMLSNNFIYFEDKEKSKKKLLKKKNNLTSFI